MRNTIRPTTRSETAQKLNDLATTSGRAPEDIVEDALAGYLEEMASARNTLDSRYDDLKNDRVKPIDGEEAFRKLHEKSGTPTIERMSAYAFHPDAFADLNEIWEYIAADNIDAAGRLLAISTRSSPRWRDTTHGHRRPDLTTRPLRFHVVRDEDLIAYAPDKKPSLRTKSAQLMSRHASSVPARARDGFRLCV